MVVKGQILDISDHMPSDIPEVGLAEIVVIEMAVGNHTWQT